MNLPNMKAPCKDCPFRKDTLKGWLGKKRMTEILAQDSFTCHKTARDRQCAGHMLIKGDANSFVRIAKGLQMETGLKGQELVFNSEIECIEHHTFSKGDGKVTERSSILHC